VDSTFSLEPHELTALVIETERAWQAMGHITFGTSSAQEEKSLAFRRSLYVTADIKAGEAFTMQNTRAIRPGHGLPPKWLEHVLTRKAASNVKRGTPLSLEILG
jgi:sialic acid synthase SpsE